MLRVLKCVVLTIVLTPVAAVGVSPPQRTPAKGVTKQNSGSSTEKTETSQQEEKDAPNVTVIVKQENSPSSQPYGSEADENIDIQRKLAKFTEKLARFTQWLVIVGLIQAVILVFTVRAIVRQTLTAINSERAWLMVEIGNMPNFVPGQGGILHLIPHIKNFGKTEGRIIRTSIRLHNVPTIGGLPKVPEYLDETSRDVILQPQVWVRPWDLSISTADFVPIYEGSAFLYFYGYVDYIDFGKNKRQTRFCFIYTIQSAFNPDPSGFYPAANVPETYTRCT